MALAPRRLLFLVPSRSISALVDAALVLGVHAGERVEDLAVDAVDRLQDALAADSGALSPSRSSMASWAPVEAPDGTAARPSEPSSSTHVHLDGRVAAAVQDLAADDVDDGGHGRFLLVWSFADVRFPGTGWRGF